MHMVTFTVANLATLKRGGSVTVTAAIADGHTHMFMVSCGAATGAAGANGAAGSSGAAGTTGAAGSPGAAGTSGAAGAHTDGASAVRPIASFPPARPPGTSGVPPNRRSGRLAKKSRAGLTYRHFTLKNARLPVRRIFLCL